MSLGARGATIGAVTLSGRTISWIAVVLAAAVGISTAKFGRAFLGQFFVNPFQMFIVIPWALAYSYVRRGFMPTRSGGRIERAVDPANFWIGVVFLTSVGTVVFVLNLLLSWVVLSRPR